MENETSMTWMDKLQPLNDVTTDTSHPPEFIGAVSLRTSGQNRLAYPGDRAARIQQQRYPDITPITSTLPPDQAYRQAREIMLKLGWKIHYEDISSGHMEAVAITRLLRFRDDIAVRVVADGGGSRIDLRSCSRLGRSDLGANARRIREFIAAFGAEL